MDKGGEEMLLTPEERDELYSEWENEVGAYFEEHDFSRDDPNAPETWDIRLLKSQLAKVKQLGYRKPSPELKELAEKLEEPRAVRLLAEWLAIDHNGTRLQYEKYMQDAQELYEYIRFIIKMQHLALIVPNVS